MKELATAASFALLLTLIFAFRFRQWRRPLVLAGYFVFFATAEFVCVRFFVPRDAFGYEIAIVCLVLTVPFAVATALAARGDVD